jgi:hypothetical protein
MSDAPPDALQRFQPYRRVVEVGFWTALCLANAIGNSITTNIDVARAGVGDRYQPWEVWTWELSSNGVLLALVPLLLWWTRRFPLHLDTWRRALPWHLVGSVAWSLLHVSAMVAIRKGVYATQGSHYDFGAPLFEFGYEYLKDVRGYALSVLIIQMYRMLLLRLQGEARLLDAPDDVATTGPAPRPERFLVRKLGREFLVGAADIEWAQAAGNYVNLHVRGRDYPLRSTIAALEERLDPARFQRVHRSYIVNLDQVASIEPLDTGDARLHLLGGQTVPCSRTYRQQLRERAGPRESRAA